MAIIERGRLVEVRSPAALVRKHCPEHAVVFTRRRRPGRRAIAALPAVRSATSSGTTHTIRGEGDDFVTDVIHVIAREGLHVRGFRTEFPTLEDVFLKLTGHTIRD